MVSVDFSLNGIIFVDSCEYILTMAKTKFRFSSLGLSVGHIGHINFVSACGLADQCWVHIQKVVGSSPVTAIVLCP